MVVVQTENESASMCWGKKEIQQHLIWQTLKKSNKYYVVACLDQLALSIFSTEITLTYNLNSEVLLMTTLPTTPSL